MNLYGGPIKGKLSLTAGQIRDLRDKYDLTCMSEEDEETFLQYLIEIGILTIADCDSYLRTGGIFFEVATKQINAKIMRLYQMAIAGRDGDALVEQIRSLQKLIGVLEQVKE